MMSIRHRSPSSRRAWIEIAGRTVCHKQGHVALLAEGVDRNISTNPPVQQSVRSPSSRMAWIEILASSMPVIKPPSPSSRRAWIEMDDFSSHAYRPNCRPPRGGRG